MKKTFSNGYSKAITFSYDDGVQQDKKLVKIFNRFGIKATFNINYGLLDEKTFWTTKNTKVQRIEKKELINLYKGHEIANHGLLHPAICDEEETEKHRLIVGGKSKLEELLNYEVKGMAYPFGKVDESMIKIMKSNNIVYGRVASDSKCFTLPTDVYRWKPTVHHNDPEIFDIITNFLETDFEEISLLYIWGHSYEFDVDKNWHHLENICKQISRHKDIWYCTNIEIIDELKNIEKHQKKM